MKYLLLLLFTFTTFVNATFPVLARRQDICSNDDKTCGDGCIPISYVCCAEFSAGCRPGTYCDKDSDGQVRCCENGKICFGKGGVTTHTNGPTGTDNQPASITGKSSDTSTGSGNTEPTGTASNNAGASDRIDGTVGYLVAAALALLL
ncbi:hypothetical protein FAUST_1845 [Fusarium austroamericanum]|uniref:Gpi anchored serine-threonine rich protein n=1 Tax=Fusarium austroamericanum TaxID=282268 RepID=A0AAN6C7M8_FUSAU|nr:hypothetical protein FAUST_1845 [Fusarium austroamericanum]